MWSALADFKPIVMESEVNEPSEELNGECICKLKCLLTKLEQKIQWISHVSVQVQEKDDS